MTEKNGLIYIGKGNEKGSEKRLQISKYCIREKDYIP